MTRNEKWSRKLNSKNAFETIDHIEADLGSIIVGKVVIWIGFKLIEETTNYKISRKTVCGKRNKSSTREFGNLQ